MPSFGSKKNMGKPRPRVFDAESDDVKTRSIETEKRLADEIGYLLNPASGALPTGAFKADGRDPDWYKAGSRRYEVKETTKPAFTLDRSTVAKLIGECKAFGNTPVFVLVMKAFESPIPQDWVLLPKSAYIELLEKQNE